MLFIALLTSYLACVPIANWFIGNVGTTCLPSGPCLVPVAPGLLAPSGVLVIGVALVLRDLVQRTAGLRWSLIAVMCGTAVSLLLSPPSLVLASCAAFALSEMVDLVVYTPLQRRGLALAVLASGVVAAIVDSTLFLALAFGSLDHLFGQLVGKWEAVAAGSAVVVALRKAIAPDLVRGDAGRRQVPS